MSGPSEDGPVETSILDPLLSDAVWEQFFEHKSRIPFNQRRVDRYRKVYCTERFRKTCTDIVFGRHVFSIPVKKEISKLGVGKKRVVYTFREDEMLFLRGMAFVMYGYDHLFTDDLYSFRRGRGVKDAIRKLHRIVSRKDMYGYKTDIHDYFNSIDTEALLEDLKDTLDDEELYGLLDSILSSDEAMSDGSIVREKKGVMAGTPISPFLANMYLRGVDEHFRNEDCVYMRYADDVLILSDSREGLESLRDEFNRKIEEKRLTINPKKDRYFAPGEPIDFLGFSVSRDCIDISPVTVSKMKGKIKRSSRSIRRWMLRKEAPLKGTIRALVREYDRKFYGSENDEMTWALWFFPSITTVESLHEIDMYFQNRIRYVGSGRFNKRNYDIVPYDMMRECGYVPLVREYYSFRESGFPGDWGKGGEMWKHTEGMNVDVDRY